MTAVTVRTLRPDELRTARDLFRSALHIALTTDDEWVHDERLHQPGRSLGAFDGELIGTTRSFDAELTVPGGARLRVGGVTGVGVRPDRTRRGVLTKMMRAQLGDFAARGVTLAALYASEATIYGRFGYGVATVDRGYTVDGRRAVLRPEVPSGANVTLLAVDAAVERLPRLYADLPHTRPGMITRPAYWWPGFERRMRKADAPVHTIIHNGPEGPDGFVVYTVERQHWDAPACLKVWDFVSVSGEAYAGLWRFLLSVDLADMIAVDGPPDDGAELLFTDPRRLTVTGMRDDLWLRLVDVPAALPAREYDGEPVVLEVTDPFLEANSGCYRVSADGVARTDTPGELRLGVDTLAMLYLGTWRASALAAAGRIQAVEPKALARADRLFATSVSAWCGTHF